MSPTAMAGSSARRGFARTRAADISRQAGVALGKLHLHLADRGERMREILFRGLEKVLRWWTQGASRVPREVWVDTTTEPRLCGLHAESGRGGMKK